MTNIDRRKKLINDLCDELIGNKNIHYNPQNQIDYWELAKLIITREYRYRDALKKAKKSLKLLIDILGREMIFMSVSRCSSINAELFSPRESLSQIHKVLENEGNENE